LETGPEMIAALFGGISTSSWARAAPRYGAIALAIGLFLLSIRSAGERADRLAEFLDTAEINSATVAAKKVQAF
jgi:hypothetical protein